LPAHNNPPALKTAPKGGPPPAPKAARRRETVRCFRTPPTFPPWSLGAVPLHKTAISWTSPHRAASGGILTRTAPGFPLKKNLLAPLESPAEADPAPSGKPRRRSEGKKESPRRADRRSDPDADARCFLSGSEPPPLLTGPDPSGVGSPGSSGDWLTERRSLTAP